MLFGAVRYRKYSHHCLMARCSGLLRSRGWRLPVRRLRSIGPNRMPVSASRARSCGATELPRRLPSMPLGPTWPPDGTDKFGRIICLCCSGHFQARVLKFRQTPSVGSEAPQFEDPLCSWKRQSQSRPPTKSAHTVTVCSLLIRLRNAQAAPAANESRRRLLLGGRCMAMNGGAAEAPAEVLVFTGIWDMAYCGAL